MYFQARLLSSGQLTRGSSLGETNSPPNCHYLALIFFLGVRTLKNVPSHISMPIDIIVIDNNSNIVLICIPISRSERFHGDQALTGFPSTISPCSLSHRSRSCDVDASVGAGISTIY